MLENKKVKGIQSPEQPATHIRNNSNSNFLEKVQQSSHLFNKKQTESFSQKIINGINKNQIKQLYKPIKSYTANTSLSLKSSQENQQVYDRLYANFSIQKQNKEQKQIKNQIKELEDCTFKPDLTLTVQSSRKYLNSRDKSTTLSDSQNVYERLSADKKYLYQIMEQQKEFNELENCTFQPELTANNDKFLVDRKYNTYEKLYNDYDKKQKHIKLKQQDKLKKEMKGCTFQPIRSSRTQQFKNSNLEHNKFDALPQEKVFTRLFSTFEKQRKIKQKLTQKVYSQALKECTFKPQIKSKSLDKGEKSQSSESPFLRLYKDSTIKEQNLNKLREDIYNKYLQENKQSLLTNQNNKNKKRLHQRSNSSGNIYDRLYQENKELKLKKKNLVLKFLQDSGINFTPNAHKQKKIQTQTMDQLLQSLKIMNTASSSPQGIHENGFNLSKQMSQSNFLPKDPTQNSPGVIARLYNNAQIKNKKSKFEAEKKEDRFKF